MLNSRNGNDPVEGEEDVKIRIIRRYNKRREVDPDIERRSALVDVLSGGPIARPLKIMAKTSEHDNR